MKELRITKGEWKYNVKHRGSCKDSLIQVIIPNGKVLQIGNISEDDCTVETCCCVEEHANAQLIADAGTTANKCGLLPSELLEQRNELLKALEEVKMKLANLIDCPGWSSSGFPSVWKEYSKTRDLIQKIK